MTSDYPEHYRKTIRRLVRFATTGIAAGLLLGFIWTEMRKSVRYAAEPATVHRESPRDGRVRFELPPGLMGETGHALRQSHGHAILLAGLLPLGFALMLDLGHRHGASQLRPGTLAAFFWLFVPGATAAIALMIYKGWAEFLAVRAGEYDLALVDAALFGGSKALRGTLYGISHSAMALGALLFVGAVWRSFGRVGRGPASS